MVSLCGLQNRKDLGRTPQCWNLGFLTTDQPVKNLRVSCKFMFSSSLNKICSCRLHMISQWLTELPKKFVSFHDMGALPVPEWCDQCIKLKRRELDHGSELWISLGYNHLKGHFIRGYHYTAINEKIQSLTSYCYISTRMSGWCYESLVMKSLAWFTSVDCCNDKTGKNTYTCSELMELQMYG